MGICLAVHSLSDSNIEKILESPPLIWRVIAPDEPEMYLTEINKNSKTGFLSKLFGKPEIPRVVTAPDLNFIEGENIEDDVDKSWHGIHYCINQTEHDAEHPLDFITLGGDSAGDVDVGYGPARLFNSKHVKEIDLALSKITTKHLQENYDPSNMEKLDIYPSIWQDEDGFEYISEYFETLKKFISNCSKNNMGMTLIFC